MKKLNKRAFSLIEVLIVIAIFGLIYSFVSPVVKNSRNKAAYETSLINLGNVAKAMEHHYLEKGKYPIFQNWDEVADPAETNPLREYVNDIPATDNFGRKYNVKESTESNYQFEGFAIPGKLAKEYPDYSFATGGKLKKGKKK